MFYGTPCRRSYTLAVEYTLNIYTVVCASNMRYEGLNDLIVRRQLNLTAQSGLKGYIDYRYTYSVYNIHTLVNIVPCLYLF